MEQGTADRAQAIYDDLEDYYFHTAGERGQAAAASLRALIARKRAAPPLL